MTILPIVGRELRVVARRPSPYRYRFVAAIVGLVICAWSILFAGNTPVHLLGQQVFYTVAITFWVLALLSGVVYTADCLSEEKREGTLGLLFLTDLRGYDVVGGKLAANSLHAWYGLMAVFPVLALPILMGSVSLADVGRVVLVLLNTLFFSLSVGVYVSAHSRNTMKAMAGTLFLVLSVHAFWPALGAYFEGRFGVSAPELFWVPSGAYGLYLASEMQYTTHSAQFHWSVGVSHGLAWLALILASSVVRRTWRDEGEQRTLAGFFGRQIPWVNTVAIVRSARASTRHLLEDTPIAWLVGRDRKRVRLLNGLFLVFLVAWLIGWSEGGRDWLDPMLCVVFAYLLHAFLKLWVAFQAAQLLGEERRSGALELLLSAPVSEREILGGMIRGLGYLASGALLVALSFDGLFLLTGLLDSELPAGDWMAVSFAVTGTFVLDLFALAWTGLWTGLRNPRPAKAAMVVVWKVLILPWAIWMVMMASTVFEVFGQEDSAVLYAWFVIMVGNSIFWMFRSRYGALQGLRELATHPIDQRVGSLRKRVRVVQQRSVNAAETGGSPG